TKLLGVRAVIAQSFERIHRSNLLGTGVLPLQFLDGEGAQSLGLSGEEVFSIEGIAEAIQASAEARDERAREVLVRAERPGRGAIGDARERRGPPEGGGGARFRARVRIDTPREAEYFRHGGILQYVMRALLAA